MKILDKIIIGIMILATLVAIQYYYNMQIRECTRNPLVYAAKIYEEKYGYKFGGTASFMGLEGNSPLVVFDSNGASISYPNSKTIPLGNFRLIKNNDSLNLSFPE